MITPLITTHESRWDYLKPQITYPFFKDFFQEFIIRNPEKVGSLGLKVGRIKDPNPALPIIWNIP